MAYQHPIKRYHRHPIRPWSVQWRVVAQFSSRLFIRPHHIRRFVIATTGQGASTHADAARPAELSDAGALIERLREEDRQTHWRGLKARPQNSPKRGGGPSRLFEQALIKSKNSISSSLP